jgi:hypothetical protein
MMLTSSSSLESASIFVRCLAQADTIRKHLLWPFSCQRGKESDLTHKTEEKTLGPYVIQQVKPATFRSSL